MKRTTLTASFVGSAAAGLIAVAIASPAWAQATTYPQGTDCSAIQNSANREDCMKQMNESRQNQIPGSPTQPAPQGSTQPAAPGAVTPAPADNAPAGTTGTGTTNGGSSGTGMQ